MGGNAIFSFQKKKWTFRVTAMVFSTLFFREENATSNIVSSGHIILRQIKMTSVGED